MGKSHYVLNHKLTMPSWSPAGRRPAPAILIPDTSTVLLLLKPIPDHFFTQNCPVENRPRTYADLLKLMPPSMVSEIHVPDVIAYELSHHAYAPIYPKPLEKPLACSRGETRFCQLEDWFRKKPERQQILSLLGIISDRRSDTLQPVKIVHFPECQEHFQNLIEFKHDKAVVQSLEKLISEKYPERSGNSKKFAKRYANIKQANFEEHLRDGDMGEIICAQYGLDYAAAHHAPVTILTEDHYAQHMINANLKRFSHHDEIEMHCSNFRGLMQAMKDAGILESAGIKPCVTAADLTRDAQGQHYGEQNSMVYKADMIADGNFATRLLYRRMNETTAQNGR